MDMDYSPRFPRAQRALDEIEAAALAQEAIDAARWAAEAKLASHGPDGREAGQGRPLTPPRLRRGLSAGNTERVLRVEHVLIAAIWLGSIGVGLFRLLM
ncbi:MAG: hypothetical protein KGJ57_01340 [Sphingomonadales bacterium]|nr:hypothetical protein [Sphingomonadales bacterium]MDE2168052.1 hypothetical protein [Sphingomonadales bacterium]